jgi:putative glutamine amidotransferase
LIVLENAERLRLPVLAICYGMQSLNVSRGGSLIQDIASEVDGSFKHEQGKPLDRNSHLINIEPESILAKYLSDGNENLAVKVNSHHHQSIRKTGKDLKVIAMARDGVVEAIQDTRERRFVVGVQWHPELSWNWDKFSAAIFMDFVNECGSFRSASSAAAI